MATIRLYNAQETAAPQRVTGVRTSQTALGSFGEGIAAVGDMAQDWQDEIDTADAKAVDNEFSELIREQLYGDETGFMYSQGSDALGRRKTTGEFLEAEHKRLLEGLSDKAKYHAQSSLQARLQGALGDIDRHTHGERRTYLDGQSEARITNSINDALINPDKMAQSLSIGRAEILDLADRNGWSPEETEQKMNEMQTAVHSGVIERISSLDPIRALEYLRDNRDQMTGSEVARLEAALVPMAKERAGRTLGAAAANGTALPRYAHSTQIDFNMGPARPNKPDQPVLDVIGRAVQDVFGAGARVVVTSGAEDEGHQHGSNRHKTGNAADVQIVRPDGSVVKATDQEAADIARAAAQLGALGIGWGAEYMGGTHMHIDLVEPGPGQANTWGSAGKAMRSEIVGIISGEKTVAPTINDLMNIADPTEREAALAEYKLINGLRASEREAARSAAQDAAFQMIEAGGNIDDLPLQYRQSIGQDAMSSLRTYQARRASGMPIVTDTAFYVELSDLMAKSPDAFMNTDPMTWKDKLDDGDFDYFMKRRSDMIAGKRDDAKDGPSISTLRTSAKTALTAAGVDGDEEVAAFETELLRWAGANPDDARDPMLLNNRINQMLVPVVINPRGLGNQQSGKAFEIDYDGKPMDPDDDLTPEQLLDATVKINGTKVDPDTMRIYAEGFNDRFGRAPTVQEVIEGLIELGLYDE